MLNDTYQNRTKIYFGIGTESHISNEIPAGTKTLLHYGNQSLRKSGLYNTIIKILNEKHIPFIELGGVQPNPKSRLVYEGIELCRQHGVAYVLAVGGGSVIDSAKAICVGAVYNGDFSDFYLKKQKPQQALPLGIVLTNTGSGSEANNSSVITFQTQQKKLGMDYVFPEFVIMNPANTVAVPLHTTLCGIFDAIAHILERYFSPSQYVEGSSSISESLVKTLMNYADLIQLDPTNYDIRAEIMWSCRLAMDKSIFLGRKGDWACHQIAHIIGAITDAPHAEILSVLYPNWLEFTAINETGMLLRFAKNIIGESDINLATEKFRSKIKAWGLPVTFRELGIADSLDLEKIATSCATINPSETLGSYQRLTKSDIYKILYNAR